MFHEMLLKLYFMKYSERNISQCIIALKCLELLRSDFKLLNNSAIRSRLTMWKITVFSVKSLETKVWIWFSCKEVVFILWFSLFFLSYSFTFFWFFGYRYKKCILASCWLNIIVNLFLREFWRLLLLFWICMFIVWFTKV